MGNLLSAFLRKPRILGIDPALTAPAVRQEITPGIPFPDDASAASRI
jgi:hypothetical protein